MSRRKRSTLLTICLVLVCLFTWRVFPAQAAQVSSLNPAADFPGDFFDWLEQAWDDLAAWFDQVVSDIPVEVSDWWEEQRDQIGEAIQERFQELVQSLQDSLETALQDVLTSASEWMEQQCASFSLVLTAPVILILYRAKKGK